MFKLNHSAIAFLLLLASVGQLSSDIYVPSFPKIAHDFNSPISTIQLTLFLYSAGFSFGAFLYGPLSDKYGRKTVLIIALIIASFGSIFCMFAGSVWLLLIGRLIQGIGFGYTGVIRAIMRDCVDDIVELSKLASLLGLIYSIFTIAGPVVGGYIARYAFWHLDFIIILIYVLALLYYCIYKFENTNSNRQSIKLSEIYLVFYAVITNRQFLLYNVISALTFACVIAYVTRSAYLLEIRLNMSSELFGYTYFFLAIMGIIGNYANIRLVARRGGVQLIQISSWITILCGVILFASGIYDLINVWIILITTGVFFGFSSFVFGNAMAGAMHNFKENAGTAGGIFSCIQNAGAALGSALISLIISHNQTALGGVWIIFGLICLTLIRVLSKDVRSQAIKVKVN